MILGKYKIQYQCGIIQIKNLIPQEVYDEFQQTITSLLKDPEPKNKKANEVEMKRLSSEFKSIHGDEYFTTNSPLALAINTGLLILPPHQGGTTNCSVTLI